MRFGSVCSGIEAASAAWMPLGWRCQFMSEIEAFPRAVLKHHYPDVPLHGDFTTIKAGEYEPIDVLVGGTPCQSFSVAGLRGGINDSRGNLALEFIKLAQRLQPRFIVWENVPGVLSSLSHDAPDPCQPPDDMDVVDGTEWVGEDEYDSDESHAFSCFLAGLSAIGYGWAYRIFDAQYAGLAQRRERVFVVASPGDWRGPSEVLSLREGLFWHPAPSREARERVAASLTRGADSGGKGGYAGRRREDDVNLVANPLGAHKSGRRQDLDNDTYAIQERAVSENVDAGPQGAGFSADMAYTLEARHHVQAVAMALNAHGGSDRMDGESDTFVCGALDAGGGNRGVGQQAASGHLVTHTLNAHRAGSVQEDGTITHTLRANGFDASEDGTGRGTPLVAYDRQGNRYASASQTNSRAVLLRVRQEIGAQAFTEWGLGILHSFHPEKILRPTVHGQEFRQATFSRSWVVCCTLGSPFSRAEGAMRSLREACGERCPSQGWGPLEQCADELGAYLSELSQPGAQAERFLRDLWQTDEGSWLLREALSEVQKAWRSAPNQNQSAQSGSAVRRLTATECEFLQGFPRNYTLIPWRSGIASDGPRYRALGNSMAVPVMAWIGRRIAHQASCLELTP